MIEVDARGLACPEPLMMASAALKNADGPITVLVDHVIPRDNILKMVRKKKKTATVTEAEGVFRIVIE